MANNTRSQEAGLSCGVPQGSILYADDSVLYVSGNNFLALERGLNKALSLFAKCPGNK